MRIGVIGTGAMACLVAARLETAVPVVMVGSWPAQLQALAAGLTLLDLTGQETHHHPIVTADPTLVAPVDVALVLVKSYQTETAVSRVTALLSPEGLAVTLQNGLGNLSPLLSAVGSGRAVQGVLTMGALVQSPGVVRHTGQGDVSLAPSRPRHPYFDPLVALLTAVGLPTQVIPDVRGLVWGKLAVNAAINPLTAVLRVRNGFLLEHENLRHLMHAAATEVAAVAAALEITLPFPDVTAEVLRVARRTQHNFSSMCQDVMRGRPTEIAAICGAVVTAGQLVGVPTPVNAQLWRWVTAVTSLSPPQITP